MHGSCGTEFVAEGKVVGIDARNDLKDSLTCSDVSEQNRVVSSWIIISSWCVPKYPFSSEASIPSLA